MNKEYKLHYRDKDAQDNQEVVTPPGLVKRIYSFLSEDDFKGKDILDPCVGPGALIDPIIEDIRTGGNGLDINSLIVMDIQPMHIENFAKNIKQAVKDGHPDKVE